MIRPWLFLSRKIKIILLPLITAILTAVYVEMDKFFLTEFIPDPLVFSFLSLWLGSFAMVFFMLIMRFPLRRDQLIGEYLDPNFQGLFVPKGKILFWILIAGISGAFSSFTYFHLVASTNPSLVIPFSRLLIVYLLILESVSDRDIPTIIEVQSVILILAGVFLMASSELAFNPLTLILVIGPYNVSNLVFTIALRNAKKKIYMNRKTDSLNIRLWVLIFNSIFTSIIFAPLLLTPESIGNILTLNLPMSIFIIIDMMVATFAAITYIRALGVAKMSIVNSITAFTVVLGIPFTLIGNLLFPGSFGTINLTGIFGMITMMGALLIVTGIVTIAISQVKGYLLIYIDGPADYVIKKLLKVKGITSVSAVSGYMMLIAVLKIRSLGKAYRTIVTELEKISGIKTVRTLTNIKEWEKL